MRGGESKYGSSRIGVKLCKQYVTVLAARDIGDDEKETAEQAILDDLETEFAGQYDADIIGDHDNGIDDDEEEEALRNRSERPPASPTTTNQPEEPTGSGQIDMSSNVVQLANGRASGSGVFGSRTSAILTELMPASGMEVSDSQATTAAQALLGEANSTAPLQPSTSREGAHHDSVTVENYNLLQRELLDGRNDVILVSSADHGNEQNNSNGVATDGGEAAKSRVVPSSVKTGPAGRRHVPPTNLVTPRAPLTSLAAAKRELATLKNNLARTARKHDEQLRKNQILTDGWAAAKRDVDALLKRLEEEKR